MLTQQPPPSGLCTLPYSSVHLFLNLYKYHTLKFLDSLTLALKSHHQAIILLFSLVIAFYSGLPLQARLASESKGDVS